MLRSLYSGVSGLKSEQVKMDVIGNNIANVSTTGFKKSRVTFADTLYQTLKGATAPTSSSGGVNATAVGVGAKVGSIDVITTTGASETTDNPLDLMLTGEGYFVMQDASGTGTLYSRAGNFGWDSAGNLVNTSSGLKVMGYMYDPTTKSISDSLTTLSKAGLETMNARATSALYCEGNLCSTSTSTDAATITQDVYDSLGNKHTLVMTCTKQDTDPVSGGTLNNVWKVSSTVDGTPTGNDVYLFFDSSGNYTGYKTIIAGPAWSALQTGTDTISVALTNGAATPQAIAVDFSSLTQNSSASEVDAKKISASDPGAIGYAAGTLKSYTVDENGIITGIYSNDQTRTICQLASALFENPSGLTQKGSSLYQVSNNSGLASIGKIGTSSGHDRVASGELEMSNVDLSEEFTNMISAQRAFQANSRIITTSDTMLEELVNLKRS